MRQSQLFTRVTREAPRDETSFNAQILMRAGFVDKLAAGIYTWLPLGLRVHNKICRLVRQQMNHLGGQEILMPALTPAGIWQTTGRWDNFDALFKLRGGDSKDYALGATHEEVVTPLVAKHVFSYKDLPLAVYQIQAKFRNEPRAKAGLLRGREFSMKDLYSFHGGEDSLNEYYKLVQEAYFKIFEHLGLLDITYLTYASGGAFSRFSHEFQTICAAGEDTIHICGHCKIAVNDEIIGQQPACPTCGNKDLRADRAIEIGNIFKLGTRFASAFKFVFRDEQGQEKTPVMGCYGLGPSRLIGTIVETSHDDQGIIWPEAVAPYRLHLLSFKADQAAEKLYAELLAAGLEVLYDDRDLSAGQKLAEADLIGCPWRLIVSDKTLSHKSVEVKRRSSQAADLVKLSAITKYFKLL